MYSNVAAVCVLYNPCMNEVMSNIDTYLDCVSKLYLVDNSDNQLIREIYLLYSDRIIYINNNCNLGIAKALNIGANLAIKDGYEWLLTMDQDSKAYPDMLKSMMNYVAHSDNKNIGIVAAQPDSIKWHDLKHDGTILMDTVITSGNLVNLLAYRKIGGYVDKLFIDYVDHCFCLSLRENGFSIIQVNRALLNHHLGNSESRFIGNLKLVVTNHTYIRRYYITRNRFYLYKRFGCKFPSFVFADFLRFLKETLLLIMYEKDRMKKIKSIIIGLMDCCRNKFGCKNKY